MIGLIMLQAQVGSFLQNYGFLILMIAVIYLFFIRPQAKRQKEQKSFLANMKKGDEVVTTSGMVGKINKIEDGYITLQVDTKTFIKVVDQAISKEMSDSYNAKPENPA